MEILPELNTWFRSKGMRVSNLDELTLEEMNENDFLLISDMDGGKDNKPASKKVKVATLLEYVRRNSK